MASVIRAIARSAPSSLRRGVERLLDPYVRRVARSIPIDQVRTNDVFIVGYPKSGTTWLQHLVAGLVFRVNLDFTPDLLVQDLVPDVHARRYYRRYLSRTFFKSHHRPQANYRRVVYLVRDGRDAIVSYHHYLNQLAGRRYNLARLVEHGEGLEHGPWHQHVEAWMANPFGAEMLVVRYEDLRADPRREVERLCRFVDLDCPPEVVDDVASKCSFEQMQARERAYGIEEWDSSQGLFVRRGKVGGFRDEMPAQALEAFNAQSAVALRRFGYLESKYTS